MAVLLKKLVLTGAILMAMASVVYGEYYQYTDTSGVLRFTDDITAVPPDQRPNVKTYQSVKSDPVQPASRAWPIDEDAAASTPAAEEASLLSAGNWNARVSAQAGELDRLQAELNKMYLNLEAERTALAAKAPPPWSSAADDIHRGRVDALNARIKAYEARLAEFKRKEADFNQQYRK